MIFHGTPTRFPARLFWSTGLRVPEGVSRGSEPFDKSTHTIFPSLVTSPFIGSLPICHTLPPRKISQVLKKSSWTRSLKRRSHRNGQAWPTWNIEADFFPECLVRFPLHSAGLGVEGEFTRRCAGVRNRRQPCATVGRRLCEITMAVPMGSAPKWSLLEVSKVVQPHFVWQAWHFVTCDENWWKPRTKHRFWGNRFWSSLENS